MKKRLPSISRPKKGEYAPAHGYYLKLVPPRTGAAKLLRDGFKEAQTFFSAIPEERGNYTYAERKWTLKQVLVHLIDFERVMSFRILSFIRADRIPLPGFNQDFWMEEVDPAGRTIKDLLKEWKSVRDNTLFLLQQCTEEQSRFPGKAAGWTVTPRALFFVIIGHQVHHLGFLREKYVEGG